MILEIRSVLVSNFDETKFHTIQCKHARYDRIDDIYDRIETKTK